MFIYTKVSGAKIIKNVLKIMFISWEGSLHNSYFENLDNEIINKFEKL
jgi:hypothetical protein